MRALRPPRRVVVPLAALVLAGTGFAAYGATADNAVSYRTVTATTGNIDQTLDLTGVIGATGRADLAFGTSGAVARVPVAVGEKVHQGQVIAALDRTSLRTALDRARSDLAGAQAQLGADKDAQTAAVSTASTTASTSTSAGKATKKSSGSASKTAPDSAISQDAVDLTALNAQQEAVITAQSAASGALQKSTAALKTQLEVCAVEVTEGTVPTATSTPSETTESTASAPSDAAPEAGNADDCRTALAAVQSAQSATADAQTSLQEAISTLAATLTTALGDPSASQSSASTHDSTPSGVAPANQTGPSDASTGSARTVTAATLAEDQAAIDRAKADQATARANLAAAVVRAPAAGTVTSLTVTKGDSVSSGDAIAVVVTPGVTSVAVEVSGTQAAQLKVGTTAEATPAGAAEALPGVITRVSNVPTSSSSGSEATYAVDIALDQRDLGLPEGLPATVELVVGSADNAVLVPTSAISDGTVTTLVNGRAQRVRVTTGIVGSTEIEIVDGLEAGVKVVLADLGADLPTGNSQNQRGFGGGFGGGLSDIGGSRSGPPGGNLIR